MYEHIFECSNAINPLNHHINDTTDIRSMKNLYSGMNELNGDINLYPIVTLFECVIVF